MANRLLPSGLSLSHRRYALICLFTLLLSGWVTRVSAQALDTQPLTVTTVCPGAQLDITGLRTSASDGYAIELSDGGTTYTEIPSVFVSASGRYEITYRATIPANTPAGKNYRVRIVSKNPDVKGTPSPSVLTVTAPPAKPAVSATPIAVCQNQATGLSATVTVAGASLIWYGTNAAGGSGSPNPPTVSTTNPGTFRYYVSQKINDCESDRAELVVQVKPIPAAPTVQSVAVCQNASAPLLQPTGQNLTWYTAASGGSGSATTPAVSTSQTGQNTYYVSQNSDGCESSRALLTVTVSAIPAAPGVTPKTVCQFSAPFVATATGQNLTWYNIDGNKFGSAPIIPTDRGGSFSVLVSQSVNGCESPKATQTITVLTTPVPVVAKTTVEVCQGATAQALEATGDNLRWTDPSGNVTTTAPVPPTQKPTANPDGDVYYVTQSANGCESPKVAIKVFVQNLPMLSIGGTTTTGLGNEIPLKLSFTGVGPYSYTLSTGLAATATKDTTILVLPDHTTVYEVTKVSNKCGVGTAGASALVTVVSPTIQTLTTTSATICAGATVTANFSTAGAFTSGNVFKLQVAKVEADTTQLTFTDVADSKAGNGQVTGTIPANAVAGQYRVRVIATNPKIPIKGTVSPTKLTVRPLPAATLVGTQAIFQGQPASLSVVLSGDAPWTFSYRDSTAATLGAIQSVTATASTQTVIVRPITTTSYVLKSVSNGCGVGSLAARVVTVTVNPLLGIEDQPLADVVDVYPVPAGATLTVRINEVLGTQPALLEITDLMGHILHHQETRQSTSSISVDRHPPGTYLLHIRVGDRTAVKRVVKE